MSVKRMRRLLDFIKKKSFLKPKLTISSLFNISIPPKYQILTYSKTTSIDISPTEPKPNYHPYVVEAIKLMYSKAPDELSADEWEQFQGYHKWKRDKGEPIETDIVYKPRTS